MVKIETFRQLAFLLDEVVEQPHFKKTSFWVNKKIFAMLHATSNTVVLKLSPTDQSIFCLINVSMIYPVPGKWGLQGWTMIELKKINKTQLQDALTKSYCTVAPKGFWKNIKTEKCSRK